MPVANGQRRRKTLKPILYDEASSLLCMNIIVYQVWYQVIADVSIEAEEHHADDDDDE